MAVGREMKQLWLLTPVLVAFAPVDSLTLILVLALALDVLVGVILVRDLGIAQLPWFRDGLPANCFSWMVVSADQPVLGSAVGQPLIEAVN
jgi:hypothetical protein